MQLKSAFLVLFSQLIHFLLEITEPNVELVILKDQVIDSLCCLFL